MTIVSAEKFGELTRQWAKKTGEDLEKITRGFCINLSTSVIIKTPVGNPELWSSPAPHGYTGGRARNNWFPSLNNISNKTTERKAKTGQAAVNRVKDRTSGLKAGDTFYLTNNLPYIRRLEYEGWSTQAPAGMVRISISEAEQSLTKAINSI